MSERDDARTTGGEREPAETEPNQDPDGGTGPDPDGERDHLEDVEDGAGCTEIWERLSERREE
ncbi:MAG: hypothetical protein ACOCZD_00970 [Haloferacaceae archaeon]